MLTQTKTSLYKLKVSNERKLLQRKPKLKRLPGHPPRLLKDHIKRREVWINKNQNKEKWNILGESSG